MLQARPHWSIRDRGCSIYFLGDRPKPTAKLVSAMWNAPFIVLTGVNDFCAFSYTVLSMQQIVIKLLEPTGVFLGANLRSCPLEVFQSNKLLTGSQVLKVVVIWGVWACFWLVAAISVLRAVTLLLNRVRFNMHSSNPTMAGCMQPSPHSPCVQTTTLICLPWCAIRDTRSQPLERCFPKYNSPVETYTCVAW